MLKYILTMCLLLTALVSKSVEGYVDEIYKMPEDKKMTLLYSYLYGLHHNWDGVLPAIAWKESNLEKVSSPQDGKMGSYGIYQVQVFYHLKAMKIRVTDSNIKAYSKKLTTNHYYNAYAAVVNLEYWAEIHGRESLTKILASYNGGNNGPTMSVSIGYAEDVIKRMKAIEKVFKNKGLDKYIRYSYTYLNDGDNVYIRRDDVLAMLTKE